MDPSRGRNATGATFATHPVMSNASRFPINRGCDSEARKTRFLRSCRSVDMTASPLVTFIVVDDLTVPVEIKRRADRLLTLVQNP